MRPPLRVEAKVAEELRNWLTSELGKLDASNTNPFAHHVVTILLHEDLDIEDEPVATDDCFYKRGIYGIKKGKSKENQKKAVVQFLRSAIACEEPLGSEIELIVEKLMIRIEATKAGLNHKKSRGRNLLGAISINVENQIQDTGFIGDIREEERRYNEAFPSLPGEDLVSKDSPVLPATCTNGVWDKSPVGKENLCVTRVRSSPQAAARKVRFTDKDEAEAYSIAVHVIALAMPEHSLPNPEIMEMFPCDAEICERQTSVPNPPSSCWKSAFYAVIPTKLFSPKKEPLFSPKQASSLHLLPPTSFSPVVVQNSVEKSGCSTLIRDVVDLVNLFDYNVQRVFLPAERNPTAPPRPSPKYACSSTADGHDLEVIHIFHSSRSQGRRAKRVVKAPKHGVSGKAAAAEVNDGSDVIQGAMCFPNHFGAYWEDMIHQGALALYPDMRGTRPQSPAEGQGESHVGQSQKTNGDGGAQSGTDETNDKCAPGAARLWSKMKGRHLTESSSSEGVTYTNDLVSFAMKGLSDLGLVDKSEFAKEKKEVERRAAKDMSQESRSPSWNRAINASSDSGILVHISGDRMSSSSAYEAPQSAPAALNWTFLDSPFDSAKPGCLKDQKTKETDAVLISDVPTQTACPLFCPQVDVEGNQVENLIVQAVGGLLASDPCPRSSPSNEKISSYNLVMNDSFSLCPETSGTPSSSEWKGPLQYSKWDSIQQHIFTSMPLNCNPSSARHGRTLSVTSSAPSVSSSTSLAAPAPIQVTSDQGPVSENFIPQDTFPMNAGANGIVSPAPFPMFTSTLFPVLTTAPLSRYLPSQLSSGIENKIARVLQSAYVNSIFSNNQVQTISQIKESSKAVNCSDLETSWLSHDKFSVEALRNIHGRENVTVKGRTCSKWLENSCFLGNACPFSHPSI